MIDLHTHTILSDGVLIPSELVRRFQEKGGKIIAITDHADASNIDFIIPRIVKVSRKLSLDLNIKVIPGIELTHIPPKTIFSLAKESKKLGAKIVLVHGETIVEPVSPGTNRYAVECKYVDILAHPGLISEKDAFLAAKNRKVLEISTRNGHSFSNGHIVKIAKKAGCSLAINTDTHTPDNVLSEYERINVAVGSGLNLKEVKKIFNDMKDFVEGLLK